MPGLDALTLYHRLGNKRANDVAILGAKNLNKELVEPCAKLFQDYGEQQQHLEQLFRFHLQAFKRRAKADKERQAPEPNTVASRQRVIDQLLGYTVLDKWTPVQSTMHSLEACVWGRTVATAVYKWMLEVTWPRTEASVEHQEWGVSWVELALSFTIHSRMWLPQKRTDARGTERMTVVRSYADILANQTRLTDWAYSFALLHDQVVDLLAKNPWPDLPRKYVKAIYVMGARQYNSGWIWRANYPFQDTIIPILCDYFHRNKGPTFEEVPHLDITMDDNVVRAIQQDLRGTWKTRTTEYRKAAKKLRDYCRAY